MSIVVLTSDHLRHRFVAATIAKHLDVSLVIVEPKREEAIESDADAAETKLLERYFGERAAAEEALFSHAESDFEALRSSGRVWELKRGTIDDPHIAERIKGSGVSLGVVYGTSIIKPPLLTAVRMINIHLGVSPYYRGSGTNFWAMYNGDFHLVGATIHELTAEVDAGAILAHVRTPVSTEDTPHTLGCRVIKLAVERAVEVARQVEAGAARGKVQWRVENGHLYRRRDFTPNVLKSFLEAWPRLVDDYLRREQQLKASIRLVS
jgi:methionyl-tRNA formyltransferase